MKKLPQVLLFWLLIPIAGLFFQLLDGPHIDDPAYRRR